MRQSLPASHWRLWASRCGYLEPGGRIEKLAYV
jgi:hypothetical protein